MEYIRQIHLALMDILSISKIIYSKVAQTMESIVIITVVSGQLKITRLMVTMISGMVSTWGDMVTRHYSEIIHFQTIQAAIFTFIIAIVRAQIQLNFSAIHIHLYL